MRVSESVLRVIRGQIAMKGILKKNLAKKCGVSPSMLSGYLWGDRPFPRAILAILLRELELDQTLLKRGLVESSTFDAADLL